ncbi:hypothetical protein M501DRAFT_991899 [Patellaria atrata CBS 101060]|uniref:Uncharacterized protein n=1 Tax=Patellaria atrata CBS 101060 TaxID=1346257 RepID=A0A9P4VQJ3_9PEZI|nr:hypothetical protein M501DRAFT_991899 [Patellaria atrata CBS 101060]
MPSQKPSLHKRLNKKKKRRFGPLRGKCREYAELPGVELALFIAFEKLRNIDGILSDDLNKNELLDEMGSDIEMPCEERDDEMEGDEKNTLVGSKYLDLLLGSTGNGPVFPPLPDLDLDLICDIIIDIAPFVYAPRFLDCIAYIISVSVGFVERSTRGGSSRIVQSRRGLSVPKYSHLASSPGNSIRPVAELPPDSSATLIWGSASGTDSP